MAELAELLQSLPTPALIVFAAVLALIFGVRHLGLLQGLKAPAAASETKAQVAAVIVDPTALVAASAEVSGLAVAVTEGTVALKKHTAAMERQGERLDALADGMDKLRTELIRAAAKME
ncbi:hypothetical protein [Devosia sp.]|uniref:hypothetical protein n=1 Tax=Devosia sp. TaxID=1871048 RepID=UPI001B052908|nr:hypothetical protein [Devosia sp.]MBO9589049.1 hypothetical protein [Devosia sp.]